MCVCVCMCAYLVLTRSDNYRALYFYFYSFIVYICSLRRAQYNTPTPKESLPYASPPLKIQNKNTYQYTFFFHINVRYFYIHINVHFFKNLHSV